MAPANQKDGHKLMKVKDYGRQRVGPGKSGSMGQDQP